MRPAPAPVPWPCMPPPSSCARRACPRHRSSNACRLLPVSTRPAPDRAPLRHMLTPARMTCGALPPHGARRRVAAALHETAAMKPLVLAIALALVVPAAAAAQAPAPQAAAAAPATPAWVEKSNADAQVLIAAQAKFQPEGFSFFGIPGYDDKVADLGPGNGERFRAAVAEAKATLEQKLQAERDPNVCQDLQI